MIATTVCSYLLVGIGVSMVLVANRAGDSASFQKEMKERYGKKFGSFAIPAAVLLTTVLWPMAVYKVYEINK